MAGWAKNSAIIARIDALSAITTPAMPSRFAMLISAFQLFRTCRLPSAPVLRFESHPSTAKPSESPPPNREMSRCRREPKSHTGTSLRGSTATSVYRVRVSSPLSNWH